MTLLPCGKDIDGDDFIRLVASVPKCSVVGNSQVAPKPVDDSSHCDETGAVILKIELTDDFAILPVLTNGSYASLAAYFHDAALGRS